MLYLLDSQEEPIPAIVIAAFEIIDERGFLAATANNESDAKRKVEQLSAKYQNHRFRYK